MHLLIRSLGWLAGWWLEWFKTHDGKDCYINKKTNLNGTDSTSDPLVRHSNLRIGVQK